MDTVGYRRIGYNIQLEHFEPSYALKTSSKTVVSTLMAGIFCDLAEQPLRDSGQRTGTGCAERAANPGTPASDDQMVHQGLARGIFAVVIRDRAYVSLLPVIAAARLQRINPCESSLSHACPNSLADAALGHRTFDGWRAHPPLA